MMTFPTSLREGLPLIAAVWQPWRSRITDRLYIGRRSLLWLSFTIAYICAFGEAAEDDHCSISDKSCFSGCLIAFVHKRMRPCHRNELVCSITVICTYTASRCNRPCFVMMSIHCSNYAVFFLFQKVVSLEDLRYRYILMRHINTFKRQ